MTPAIMIQGTGSNVGKSLIVAGLARAFSLRGLSVAPFKPQNMSNNAAVTEDGGEIGRAQALQARAAGRAPHTDMNPVLLKPEGARGAQVIVQGHPAGSLNAGDYTRQRPRLLGAVLESFHRLSQSADLVLVEGAGSPAEINLRAGDIANMGFARAAGVPVILVGDIDRGGVIAQIVGTKAVIDPADAAMIRGFAVNKFRGELDLFRDGERAIADRTGWPSLGVVPWFEHAWRLPPEDVQDLGSIRRAGAGLHIAVPHLGMISNFDDLTPLGNEPNLTVEIVPAGKPLPANADLILLAGSKSTIADLETFRTNGWDIDLAAHIRRKGRVLGVCGGYQMLGRRIADPDGIEGPPGAVAGRGPISTWTPCCARASGCAPRRRGTRHGARRCAATRSTWARPPAPIARAAGSWWATGMRARNRPTGAFRARICTGFLPRTPFARLSWRISARCRTCCMRQAWKTRSTRSPATWSDGWISTDCSRLPRRPPGRKSARVC